MTATSKICLCSLTLLACGLPALAQTYTVTSKQKTTASQVAQTGVPLSELVSNAPNQYTIKSGDSLWAVSRLFLKSPWRWPELWGMNMAEIKNPHLIYPGQQLFLDKTNGRAHLRSATGAAALPTVFLSPTTRVEQLGDGALPTIKTHLIAPFLSEPVIVDALGLTNAARIVATRDGRVLLTRGDRAYARGAGEAKLIDDPSKPVKAYRVFRNAMPLKDPSSGQVLGYEAQYVGKAVLVASETTLTTTSTDGKTSSDIVPASIDIVSAKEEMRVGDRLLPEPPPQFASYVPHAPRGSVDARVVSVYGSAVVNAAQNQVVALNRGSQDGLEVGHVLAILKDGPRVVDKTDASRAELKLPDERNGLLMVFRAFDRLSYALVLEILDGVKVGDHLVNPN